MPLRTFPQQIKKIGIELEGYWPFQHQRGSLDIDEAPEPQDCDWGLCEFNGGDPEDAENWTRCWRCEDYTEHGAPNQVRAIHEREARNLKSDGSVHCPDHLRASHVDGEATSSILTTWADTEAFVRKNYPDLVDHLCGLHVHIECTRPQWGFSFDQKYWDHLNDTLLDVPLDAQTQNWLEHRIAYGRSSEESDYYCMPNKERHGIRESDRYSAVNYRAFNTHGTLEIRVCPMAETDARGAGPAKALALIYGVLQATSEYWTQPFHWRTRKHTVILTEDLPLHPIHTEPQDEHATFTI